MENFHWADSMLGFINAMSPLQATTTSDAEFAIENNVSTRASSCLKEREPGAGEAGSAGLEGREASVAGAEA